MKKFIVLFSFVVFIATGLAFSQDIIIKNDKTEIEAKVIEIQEEFIKYTLFDSLSGPLRNIRISNVFMIIYQDGTRETFSSVLATKPVQEQVQEINPLPTQESTSPISQQENVQSVPLGYITQGHLGVTIPYNEDVSEIYGYLPSIGITSGYWGKRFGVECIWDYSRMNGDPYTEGNAENAEAVLKIHSLTFCGYYAANSTKKSFFYVGGGIGYAYVNEKISAKLNGQYYEDEVGVEAVKFSIQCGMKISLFFWEFNVSDVVSSDIDVNFGGFAIKAGLFF